MEPIDNETDYLLAKAYWNINEENPPILEIRVAHVAGDVLVNTNCFKLNSEEEKEALLAVYDMCEERLRSILGDDFDD